MLKPVSPQDQLTPLYKCQCLQFFFHTLKFESLTKIDIDILYYKNLSGNLRLLPNMIWNLPVESLFESAG